MKIYNLKYENKEYEDIMICLFKLLIDIYDIDKAIIILYKINSLKGIRI